jgi:hypothetical protein
MAGGLTDRAPRWYHRSSFPLVKTRSTEATCLDGQRFTFDQLAYEPDSISTFFKVQGKTLPAIIVDLNQPRGNIKSLDLASVVVALSRCRTAAGVAILPVTSVPGIDETPGGSLSYLRKLRRNPVLQRFLYGFEARLAAMAAGGGGDGQINFTGLLAKPVSVEEYNAAALGWSHLNPGLKSTNNNKKKTTE